MADAIKSLVADQNIVSFKMQLQNLHADNQVRPTSGQTLAMRTLLRSLLGEIDFDRLCPGIKVGTIDEDVLQVFVPAENCAADIKFRHSDDFAVAAEYGLGQPIRKVNIFSADYFSIRGFSPCAASCIHQFAQCRDGRSAHILHEMLKW
jgi:hypothetical protein